MEFHITSFLIGLVVGLTIAFLLKLKSLKSLDLNLKKLGIGLGVQGFEEQDRPGVSIRDVSGDISGDIAGRDVNKNSSLYKNINAATMEAMSSKSILQKVIQLSLPNNPDFPEYGGDADIDTYLTNLSPGFKEELFGQIKDYLNNKWRISSIRPTYKSDRGLYLDEVSLEITLEKPYKLNL
jgi:hypothetical protein